MRCLGLCFILLLWTACNTHTPTPSDTLIIGIDNFPKQFDPRLSAEALSAKINKLIYAGLLARDARMNLVGDLAQSWAQPDQKTYVFKLRQDAVFHDGKSLVADDVRATYDTILAGQLRSAGIAIRDLIDRIEAPDKTTVIFHLKKPYAPFLSLMTIGILPADVARHKIDGEKRSGELEKYQDLGFVIGTGPFSLVSADLDSGIITLQRHEKYHGSRPHVRQVQFRVIRDGTLRTMELMKGRIDLVQNAIPYALIAVLREKPELNLISAGGINFTYMAFNLRHPALSQVNVRRAIASAIDRDRIIRYKLEGLAVKATSILSPAHVDHNPELSPIEFDPSTARALLDAAGFPDPDGDGPQVRFNLIYKTSSDRERIEIAQLMAENLRAVGIGVEIKSYEFGTFYRDIKQGDFDIFTLSWVGFSDADGYYDKFHSSQFPPAGNNRGFYSNPRLDKLLDASRIEGDHAKRSALYWQIQKIVYDDFVYAPLWYDTNFVFVRNNITSYELRPDAGFQGMVQAIKSQEEAHGP